MTWRAFLPLVVLGAAVAQVPPGPPPLDELKAYLNLTDSQIQSLQQIRQQAITSQQTVFAQIQSKQQALHDLLEKGTSDALAVGKLMLDIRALQKQIEQAMTASRTQAVNSLTTEQKTKLAALEQAAKLRPAIEQATLLGLLEAPLPGPGGPGGWGLGPMRNRFGGRALGPTRTRPVRRMVQAD